MNDHEERIAALEKRVREIELMALRRGIVQRTTAEVLFASVAFSICLRTGMDHNQVLDHLLKNLQHLQQAEIEAIEERDSGLAAHIGDGLNPFKRRL